jgi:gentisate 1,2-dioxygenase
MSDANQALPELEKELATYHLRGQWQGDPNRALTISKGDRGQVYAEPMPGGMPHIWRWDRMEPFLKKSLEALEESNTARRTLVMSNPGLDRGATQTLMASIQTIRPGETAWAHRHTITALRFVIEGGSNVFTVVDGQPLMMEPYDLILTPGWMWHDHHNESGKPATWLDGLDVPLMHNLNQIFYEELGAEVQNRKQAATDGAPLLRKTWDATGVAQRPLRYPWRDTLDQLESLSDEPGSPYDGIALEYINPATGGATLPTISCWIQMLPPGFEGQRHRHTSSAVYFVVGGEGSTVFDDQTIDWQKHDSIALPNWAWHQHVNRSSKEPAYLFSINDTPVLRGFGLYREEPEITLADIAPYRQAE